MHACMRCLLPGKKRGRLSRPVPQSSSSIVSIGRDCPASCLWQGRSPRQQAKPAGAERKASQGHTHPQSCPELSLAAISGLTSALGRRWHWYHRQQGLTAGTARGGCKHTSGAICRWQPAFRCPACGVVRSPSWRTARGGGGCCARGQRVTCLCRPRGPQQARDITLHGQAPGQPGRQAWGRLWRRGPSAGATSRSPL